MNTKSAKKLTKTDAKSAIKGLKSQVNEAIAAGESTTVKRLRRDVRVLKRRSRAAVKEEAAAAKAAAAAPKPAEEAPAAEPTEEAAPAES